MSSIGLNARMSELHAIFGLESLSTFKQRQKRKLSLVEEYKSCLPEATFQQTTENSTHSYKDFAILLGDKKQKVKTALDHAKIPFKEYFRPISNLKAYYGMFTPQRNAWNAFQSIVQLPLHDNMTEDDCRRIAKVVLSVIGEDVQGRGEGVLHGIASTVRQEDSPHVLQEGGHGSK
jgi:dTDP-4-amino-4,6-dideoxygalactose transaminase